jgi:hypothetical protein
MKGLTKASWNGLKAALLSVPIRGRNMAWKEGLEMVETILDGRNNLAPEIIEKLGKFAVQCDICKDAISLEDDFVRKGMSCVWVHYDCHMRSSEDRV